MRQITIVNYLNRNWLKTGEDLKILLLSGLGIVVSDRVNCAIAGHTSPFSFLSDVVFRKVSDALVWANRSGGKSYLAGLITWLRSARYPKSGTKILGGSFEQSEKSYYAINDLWERCEMMTYFLKSTPLKTKTEYKNGSNIEILTASQNSVRGPHQQNLIDDEAEEMDFDIFEASLSQPQAGFGIPSSTIILSTMHKRYGNMNYLMENHQKMGLKLYKWCAWEVVESCRDYNCSTCPIRSICPGKQLKQAEGHYLIEDLFKKMQQLSMRAFATEWLCQSLSREGLVYSVFDEDRNTTEQGFDSSRPVGLGIDWGGTNPFAVTVWQEFDGVDVQIDEIYIAETRNSLVLAEAKTRKWWNNIKAAFADPSRPDLIREWYEELRSIGASIIGVESEILEGIDLVESKISPLVGKPTLMINRLNCKMTLFEYNSYHYQDKKPGKQQKEEPDKVYDHAMDSTRYFIVGKHKKISHFERDERREEKLKPMSAGLSW